MIQDWIRDNYIECFLNCKESLEFEKYNTPHTYILVHCRQAVHRSLSKSSNFSKISLNLMHVSVIISYTYVPHTTHKKDNSLHWCITEFQMKLRVVQINNSCNKCWQVSVNGTPYHKSCFKCSHGGCVISPSNYIAHEGRLYCKHHHIQLIKEKGNLSQLEGDHDKDSVRTGAVPAAS